MYGFDTGTALTTGDHNTIIGYQAGDALVDSGENVFIGSQCATGANQSTASRNVIIGYEAVKTQDNPKDLVAIGYRAMANSKDDASDNVAIGAYCLEHQSPNQEVYSITAIGAYAGQKTQSGFGQSVLVGYAAGQNINNSDFTTAIGHISLRGTSSAPLYGYHNTGCGYATLGALQTTGEKNTALGSQAGDNLTTGSNNICIGNAASASAADVSNEIH